MNGTETVRILDSGQSAAGWSCFCIEMKRSFLAFCGGGFCDPLQNFPTFVLLAAWAGLGGSIAVKIVSLRVKLGDTCYVEGLFFHKSKRIQVSYI